MQPTAPYVRLKFRTTIKLNLMVVLNFNQAQGLGGYAGVQGLGLRLGLITLRRAHRPQLGIQVTDSCLLLGPTLNP